MCADLVYRRLLASVGIAFFPLVGAAALSKIKKVKCITGCNMKFQGTIRMNK